MPTIPPLRRLLLLIGLLLPLAAVEPSTAAPVFSDAEWAGSQPATPGPAAAGAPSTTAVLGSIAISLLAVSAVAVGLGLLLKHLGVRRLVAGRGRHLAVIETIPVAYKRQVSLVRIGDQVVLVGIGEHELCHLGTLPAGVLEAGPAEALPPSPAPAAAPSAFQQVLAGLGRKRP